MSEVEKIARMLAAQKREWPTHLEGAKQGNPYATLCEHCHFRHAPPRDDLCPRHGPTLPSSLHGEAIRAAMQKGVW
jgi:cytochrome c2